jgi:hypothetical protein
MEKWKSPAKSGVTFPLSHRLYKYIFFIFLGFPALRAWDL